MCGKAYNFTVGVSMFKITESAAAVLDREFVIRETDRNGHPHLLVKVPEIEKIPDADIGLEVKRDEDATMLLNLLVYDVPTEPIGYQIRLDPGIDSDLGFLRSMIAASQFRMHPCARVEGIWKVGPAQTFRIPPNVLLRLKHFSLDWPQPVEPPRQIPDAPPRTNDLSLTHPGPSPDDSVDLAEPIIQNRLGQPDPRDTVIKKLKEQNHILRDQLRTKDKRIIELEDELNDIKSKGRGYKLSDKKSWWNPF